MILLHEEIVQFVKLMEPQTMEMQIWNEFVQRVKVVILNLFRNNKKHGVKDDDGEGREKNKEDKNNQESVKYMSLEVWQLVYYSLLLILNLQLCYQVTT